jgi:cytosine/adenosine deaminase-related metal-dependent hydrolase
MTTATLCRARYLLPIGAPPVEDGALLTEGGRILAVGRHGDLAAAHPRAVAVDFGDAVIMPPLVNAHTHLELTDFPQWSAAAGDGAGPADFVDWVMHLVRVRRAVAVADLRDALAAGLARSLRAGTGAIGDILTTLPAVAAYAGTPLRGRVYAEVLGIDAGQVATRLAEVGVWLATPPGPALDWGLSPHAPYTLNAATLAQVLDLARSRCLPLATHWAESAAELDFLEHAAGPLRRLYQAAGWSAPAQSQGAGVWLAALPQGTLLVHGVHMSAAAIEAVAVAGLHLALCPRSNQRFGAARAPVAACRRAGIQLALGTDSLASSPSLSVWDELAFAWRCFAGALDPLDWLEIATAGGAAALGLDGQMGRLTPGLEASFQVVAVPAGAAATDLAEALCAGGQDVAVQALYLGGENVLPLL